jgi:hypothetical protein
VDQFSVERCRFESYASGYARQVLERALGENAAQKPRPKKSAFGLLAQYGRGPSAEEFDENRREMFRGSRGRSVIAGVADTHAALWYLFRNPLLSATARSFIDNAAAAGTPSCFLRSAWQRLST